ncbi:hypothetical protein OIU76_023818 [Salix suchowensis]|nr:hypothetical protein OIU76_023818 [Salix suchowensis]
MAWNNHILTTGGMDGQIISYNIVETLIEGIHENKNERGTALLSWVYAESTHCLEISINGKNGRAQLRKYPSMVKMATAAGAETLRFWNVFGVPEMACS